MKRKEYREGNHNEMEKKIFCHMCGNRREITDCLKKLMLLKNRKFNLLINILTFSLIYEFKLSIHDIKIL